MTDDKAKQDLRKMLCSFTAGGILHLLARVYWEDARNAQEDGNPSLSEDLMTVGGAHRRWLRSRCGLSPQQ